MHKIPIAEHWPNPGEDNTESIDESYKKLPGKEPLNQNLENQDVLANVEAFQNGKYVSINLKEIGKELQNISSLFKDMQMDFKSLKKDSKNAKGDIKALKRIVAKILHQNQKHGEGTNNRSEMEKSDNPQKDTREEDSSAIPEQDSDVEEEPKKYINEEDSSSISEQDSDREQESTIPQKDTNNEENNSRTGYK